jgi:SAM-dependent methyltransferase
MFVANIGTSILKFLCSSISIHWLVKVAAAIVMRTAHTLSYGECWGATLTKAVDQSSLWIDTPKLTASTLRAPRLTWTAFWNTSRSIYVNAHHKDVHYRLIAQEITGYLPSPTAHVLDYGSGEALYADRVAAAAGQLLLCETAPLVRAGIATRFANNPRIRSVAPEDVQRLPPQSLDLIVLHSVAQYLMPEEVQPLFALFHRLLNPNGVLLVSDVMAPDLRPITDAWALLRFAAANGFLAATLAGLVRMRLSKYWRVRMTLGLACYGEAAMIKELAAAGFSVRRAPQNIGHNKARMTFIARSREAQSDVVRRGRLPRNIQGSWPPTV